MLTLTQIYPSDPPHGDGKRLINAARAPHSDNKLLRHFRSTLVEGRLERSPGNQHLDLSQLCIGIRRYKAAAQGTLRRHTRLAARRTALERDFTTTSDRSAGRRGAPR